MPTWFSRHRSISQHWIAVALVLIALPLLETTTSHESHDFSGLLIGIAIILVLSKVAVLLERIKQPPVLGEIMIGIVLSSLSFLGFSYFRDLTESTVIQFLGQVGVILLLFQIGLESNIKRLTKVGARAFYIAFVGIALTIGLVTWGATPLLFPDMEFLPRIFMASALASTSVAVSSRIFKDAGKLGSSEGQTFLGAAIIDDTLGLIILSVMSGIASHGAFELTAVGLTIVRSLVFLSLAIVLGQLAADKIGSVFSRISTASNMKMTVSVAFCFAMAYVAKLFGMEPIIGAFAAGLVLDPVHFEAFDDPEVLEDIQRSRVFKRSGAYRGLLKILKRHHERHVEDLIETVAGLFVPLFFVLTGLAIDVATFLDSHVVFGALILTVAAYVAKLAGGWFASPNTDKLVVGLSMVPRGEVGLIFATIGMSTGLLDQSTFAMVVMAILLTIVTAPGMIISVMRRV